MLYFGKIVTVEWLCCALYGEFLCELILCLL
jgi:hypothetical protein